MFCDWIFDASGHGGFVLPTIFLLIAPFVSFFIHFVWLLTFGWMVCFRFLIELILFNRIYSIELQVFKSQCRVQYTDAYSLRFALRFFSPRNIQRYCFIIPILIYRCAWVTVLKWTNDYMCVCAYMFLLLLRVGTHHYRLTTNWNCWKRVLYILLLLLMLFVNNYTIERNSNSMTTNYNDVGEWNGTVREKNTHSYIKSHPVGVPGYCVRFDLLRFVYIWTNSKRMFTVFIIQIETAWQVFRCCVFFSFKQI